MLGDVGQRLLRDAVEGDLHVARDAAGDGGRRADLRCDGVVRRPIAHETRERRRQSELVQRGGPQLPGEEVQSVVERLRQLQRPSQSVASRRRCGRRRRRAIARDRHEAERAVVAQACGHGAAAQASAALPHVDAFVDAVATSDRLAAIASRRCSMANATSSAAAEVSSSSDCVVVNGTFRPSVPTSQSIRVTLRRSFTRRNARDR